MKKSITIILTLLIFIAGFSLAGCSSELPPGYYGYGPVNPNFQNYPERLSPVQQLQIFENILTNKTWESTGVYSISDNFYTDSRFFTIDPINDTLTLIKKYHLNQVEYNVSVTYYYSISGYDNNKINVSFCSKPPIINTQGLPDKIKEDIAKPNPVGFDFFFYDNCFTHPKYVKQIIIFEENKTYHFKAL